jgi:hypothetical protein
MKYQLYTYDIWGNARDGFEVNDVYRQSLIVDISENTSDMAINRRIGGRGIEWGGEHGYTLYGTNKRNGCPVCELRAVGGDA